MPPSEPVHSQQPLAREGKIVSSASFAASNSIADPSFLVYQIEIQGDSDLYSVPTSKLEARKMTENPFDTQKGKTLALCHAILPPSERCNRLLVRCYMARAQYHYIQKNRCVHTPLHLARDKGYNPPSFHQLLGQEGEVYMLGPRIPVHSTPCMLLCYLTQMNIVATYFHVFQT